jgi:hypothetical protein
VQIERELRATGYARLAVWLEACAAAGPGEGTARRVVASLDGGGPVDQALARRGVLALAQLGWLYSVPEARVPAGLVRRRVGQPACGRRVRPGVARRGRRR